MVCATGLDLEQAQALFGRPLALKGRIRLQPVEIIGIEMQDAQGAGNGGTQGRRARARSTGDVDPPQGERSFQRVRTARVGSLRAPINSR